MGIYFIIVFLPGIWLSLPGVVFVGYFGFELFFFLNLGYFILYFFYFNKNLIIFKFYLYIYIFN